MADALGEGDIRESFTEEAPLGRVLGDKYPFSRLTWRRTQENLGEEGSVDRGKGCQMESYVRRNRQKYHGIRT